MAAATANRYVAIVQNHIAEMEMKERVNCDDSIPTTWDQLDGDARLGDHADPQTKHIY